MDVRSAKEQQEQRSSSSACCSLAQQVCVPMTALLERSWRRGRRANGFLNRRTWIIIFVSVVFTFSILQWTLSLPPPLHTRSALNTSCPASSVHDEPYVVYEDAVCSNSCGKQCFPRVRGLCISHEIVTICDRGVRRRRAALPSELRFAGEDQFRRRNVAIKRGTCVGDEDAVWIRGLQMVADMKMMPNGHRVGPNPHHEAEKVIPAILLSHLYGLNKSSLYWFTDPVPSVTSIWSVGMIAAFAEGLDVTFSNVPGPGQPPLCFEDAVLFSGVTNAGYMPGKDANDWLRKKVLAHCKIPELRAKRPVKDVVVLQRLNSSRNVENIEELDTLLERELRVPVKHITSGVGDFCEQAKVVAEADFFLTPHGSHNINFLFARPGAVVMEAFPLLYYVDWFHNYVHAARLNHFELHGTWPSDQGGMPIRMRIYSLLLGWKHCFSVRQCMNYAKSQRVFVDVDQMEGLLHALTSSCRLAVKGSWCLSAGSLNTGIVH